MKVFLLFIIVMFPSVFAIAQGNIPVDTSEVVVRSFNSAELQAFKKDKDFQYTSRPEQSNGLWEKFWNWVWEQVASVMRTKNGRTTVRTILIGLGVAAILFFIIKVMGMTREGLFSRDGEIDLPYTTKTEDINKISFNEAIKTAIENRNYRLAIRLLYLQSLKQLSDKGYIEWNVNKTNNDYVSELSGRSWQLPFKKLTNTFEYAWYGEVNVAAEEFQHLQAQFQQFNNQL